LDTGGPETVFTPNLESRWIYEREQRLSIDYGHGALVPPRPPYELRVKAGVCGGQERDQIVAEKAERRQRRQRHTERPEEARSTTAWKQRVQPAPGSSALSRHVGVVSRRRL